MRCYLLIIIAVFLTGCQHHAIEKTQPIAAPPAKSTTAYRAVARFNQVDVSGRINVSLHTGYKKPQLILKGDPRDLAQVHTTVSQNTLYISVGKGFPQFGPLHADIRGQFLNRFKYIGDGTIVGRQLHTSSLDIDVNNSETMRLAGSIGLRKLTLGGTGSTQINGITRQNLQVHLIDSPRVQLTGFTSLSQLTVDGNGWLSLYWIKSNELTIRAKQGAKIQLAGAVNRLDLQLWDTAQFKGRYLRALRSFVKTHNKSSAELSSVNHQSTLATDASDIYYYNIPNTRADFMAFNGSVLNMREWSQFDNQDFSRYNKQFP